MAFLFQVHVPFRGRARIHTFFNRHTFWQFHPPLREVVEENPWESQNDYRHYLGEALECSSNLGIPPTKALCFWVWPCEVAETSPK